MIILAVIWSMPSPVIICTILLLNATPALTAGPCRLYQLSTSDTRHVALHCCPCRQACRPLLQARPVGQESPDPAPSRQAGPRATAAHPDVHVRWSGSGADTAEDNSEGGYRGLDAHVHCWLLDSWAGPGSHGSAAEDLGAG
jgi:hypothetical protein